MTSSVSIMMPIDHYEALETCLLRYRVMCEETSKEFPEIVADLTEFMDLFEMNIAIRFPIPKLCRWLGYLQGVLIERGLTTVQAERDWTRPMFQHLEGDPHD